MGTQTTQLTFTCLKSTIETLKKRCEICSKLTTKTPERHQWRYSGVFIVNFEHISHLLPLFQLLTFNMWMLADQCLFQIIVSFQTVILPYGARLWTKADDLSELLQFTNQTFYFLKITWCSLIKRLKNTTLHRKLYFQKR